jgi:hypothetical protein
MQQKQSSQQTVVCFQQLSSSVDGLQISWLIAKSLALNLK